MRRRYPGGRVETLEVADPRQRFVTDEVRDPRQFITDEVQDPRQRRFITDEVKAPPGYRKGGFIDPYSHRARPRHYNRGGSVPHETNRKSAPNIKTLPKGK
jgi:hypothetical protein